MLQMCRQAIAKLPGCAVLSAVAAAVENEGASLTVSVNDWAAFGG